MILKIQKLGDSLGIIFPKKLIEEKRLRENDTVSMEVLKVADLSDSYGSLKRKLKMSGQEFKDMVRKGWDT